ncbi:MAG TPA: phospholipase D family protein, partial [Anaerolineales bacterium]|nr:phospholipase D family protein [Anaerolineales bacterium]
MTNSSSSRLVTTPSLEFLLDMFSKAKSEIIIVSPWIKYSTLQKVIDRVDPNENIIWKVLTRNNHDDFLAGFSDIDAFKLMVENNAFDLRAIRQLHAKVYIVDGVSSLVTSANLTVGGMEINTEAGIASTDPNEVSELLKEFKIWFDQANLLDELWLVEEQQKLLESKKQEWIEIEIPFDPADYPNLEEGEPQKTGKYRELPLPTVWIPVLDSLRETETPTDMDYLLVNDLVSATIDFFEYVKSIPDGKRIQGFLVNWLIHKQTFEFIGDEKISRERVSQKIGKRKNNTENIWNSI